MKDCAVNCLSTADFLLAGYIMGGLLIVGFFVFTIWLILVSKANDSFNCCPKCGGSLGQCFLNGDDREDLVICDKCENLFVMDDDGLSDVFGVPPTTKGGNHDERRTD